MQIASEALRQALSNNDVTTAKALFKQYPELIQITDKHSCTPLMHAVLKGQLDMVDMILSFNPDLEIKNSWGSSALCVAARNGFPKICELLLQSGANPNCKQPDGKTPIMIATQNQHNKTVQVLMAFGARAASTDFKGNTVADIATSNQILSTISSGLSHPQRPQDELEQRMALNLIGRLAQQYQVQSEIPSQWQVKDRFFQADVLNRSTTFQDQLKQFKKYQYNTNSSRRQQVVVPPTPYRSSLDGLNLRSRHAQARRFFK